MQIYKKNNNYENIRYITSSSRCSTKTIFKLSQNNYFCSWRM